MSTRPAAAPRYTHFAVHGSLMVTKGIEETRAYVRAIAGVEPDEVMLHKLMEMPR